MKNKSFISSSYEETLALGEKLVTDGEIGFGDIVALCGDLGAGKTSISKGIAQGFQVAETVTSPTFAIVNGYEIRGSGKNKKYLYHFDMYRIETEDDFYSVDFFDYVSENSVILIEWFENIEKFWGKEYSIKKILIEKDAENENIRRISLSL